MKFTVSVPATTANLGPGFDTAGIALTLYNQFTFDFTKESGIEFFDEANKFDTSLTLDAFFMTLKQFGFSFPINVTLSTQSIIPITRGLGSSSACIVAGVMAANHYGSLNLNKHEIAQIASIIEGHPDNVAPAVLGNLVLSICDDQHFYAHPFPISDSLSFIAVVPDTPVTTELARKALPPSYAISEVVYSLSRTALVSTAFQGGNQELLRLVTQDKLHEPYRQPLIEDYAAIMQAISSTDAITAWISGAGPTIMVLVQKSSKKSIYDALSQKLNQLNLTIYDLELDVNGATIT